MARRHQPQYARRWLCFCVPSTPRRWPSCRAGFPRWRCICRWGRTPRRRCRICATGARQPAVVPPRPTAAPPEGDRSGGRNEKLIVVKERPQFAVLYHHQRRSTETVQRSGLPSPLRGNPLCSPSTVNLSLDGHYSLSGIKRSAGYLCSLLF